MRVFRFILVAVLSLSLAGCVKDRYDRGNIVVVGDRLPEFSVTMSDGTTVSTSDLAGSVSLIMFFDVTCGDCQNTLPGVNRLYLELGVGSDDDYFSDSSGSEDGSNDGVVSGGQVRFVLISRAQDYETVSQYWTECGYSVPFSAQPDRSVYNLFATNIVPRIYISDPTLTVRYTFDDDPVPSYADLLSALQSLLSE
ncbi:MAG: redoxin domain-containing protein [Bacteroidales bacterium]|nr:redoxin domain-containing protein [Bacteroidales bacterium]